MVSATCQKIYGTDLVAAHIPNLADYMQFIETRPAAQKVATDRAAAMAAFLKK
jgi:glutathione S-transferase